MDSSDDFEDEASLGSLDEEEAALAGGLSESDGDFENVELMGEGEDEEEEAGAAGPSGAGPEPRKQIYNTDQLHDKLEDIGWSEQADWLETQVITSSSRPQIDNVEDDLTRELAFFNQALDAAKQAVGRFEEARVPWARPADYYAEMVKSDQHMSQVKQQLVHQQSQIEGADERRKQRELKKYSKEVQAEKRKERAQEKKRSIADVSRLRKRRAQSGYSGELDVEAELAGMEERRRPMSAGDRIRGGIAKGGKKRQAKDSKFGFGGRKRLGKQNDATSAADMSSMPSGRGRGGFRGRGRGRGGPPGRGGRGGASGGRGGSFSSGGPSRGRGRGGSSRGGSSRGASGGRGGNRPGKARRAASRGRGS
ncbi:hypothetical protein WJX84_002448 [Apatococcus fuscideae]|uniref:rRNA-processing protein EBP2 n=1 Tax=Apatococcus fuscideae TaxID=2026836 RepID=A0AAW1SZX4_9CHLO